MKFDIAGQQFNPVIKVEESEPMSSYVINEYEEYLFKRIRDAFLLRLTFDSNTHDKRRWDFNQALFDKQDGYACFNGTDLGMVLQKFDEAISDLIRYDRKEQIFGLSEVEECSD